MPLKPKLSRQFKPRPIGAIAPVARKIVRGADGAKYRVLPDGQKVKVRTGCKGRPPRNKELGGSPNVGKNYNSPRQQSYYRFVLYFRHKMVKKRLVNLKRVLHVDHILTKASVKCRWHTSFHTAPI